MTIFNRDPGIGLAQVKKISTMFKEISNQSTEKARELLPKAIKLIKNFEVEDGIKNKLLEIGNRMIEDNNKRSAEVGDKISGALGGMGITGIPAVTLGKMKSNVDSSKVVPVSTPEPSSVSDPTSTPASVETPTPKKKPKYIYKPSNTITPDYTEANKSYAERKAKLDLLNRIKADKASGMDTAGLQEKYMGEYNKNYAEGNFRPPEADARDLKIRKQRLQETQDLASGKIKLEDFRPPEEDLASGQKKIQDYALNNF